MCVQQWLEVEAVLYNKRTSASWLKDVGIVLIFAFWYHTQVLKRPDIKSAHVRRLAYVFCIFDDWYLASIGIS